jgi:hypothetical protein
MTRRSKGNKRRTEFQDLTTNELDRMLRNKSLDKAKRRAVAQELKARKRRNRQKRRSG